MKRENNQRVGRELKRDYQTRPNPWSDRTRPPRDGSQKPNPATDVQSVDLLCADKHTTTAACG